MAPRARGISPVSADVCRPGWPRRAVTLSSDPSQPSQGLGAQSDDGASTVGTTFTGGLALLDYEQSAVTLGCTPRLVRKLVETRQLDSVKVGRLVRIEPAAVARYIDRHRRKAAGS